MFLSFNHGLAGLRWLTLLLKIATATWPSPPRHHHTDINTPQSSRTAPCCFDIKSHSQTVEDSSEDVGRLPQELGPRHHRGDAAHTNAQQTKTVPPEGEKQDKKTSAVKKKTVSTLANSKPETTADRRREHTETKGTTRRGRRHILRFRRRP